MIGEDRYEREMFMHTKSRQAIEESAATTLNSIMPEPDDAERERLEKKEALEQLRVARAQSEMLGIDVAAAAASYGGVFAVEALDEERWARAILDAQLSTDIA